MNQIFCCTYRSTPVRQALVGRGVDQTQIVVKCMKVLVETIDFIVEASKCCVAMRCILQTIGVHSLPFSENIKNKKQKMEH